MQLSEFASIIVLKLNQIQQSDFSPNGISLGLVEFIENKRFLEELQALAVKHSSTKTELTFDQSNPLLALVTKHMTACAGTEGSVINYNLQQTDFHQSPANNMCVFICNQLVRLAAERLDKREKAPRIQDFLMPPSQRLDLKDIPLRLKENMLAVFKKDKERVVRILETANFNMGMFAKWLLNELEQLPKDNPKLHPIIYFESLFTLEELKKLLTSYSTTNEPITRANLQTLQKFMHQRWQRINGSSAYYNRCPYSGANVALELLKYYLTIANLKDDYLNGDPESYLKHKTKEDMDEATAAQRLRTWVVEQFSTRVELSKYAIQEWGRNSVTYNLNGVRDMNRDELGQRMVLFCVFQMYIDNRRKMTSGGVTLFGGYTGEDKVKAAEAVQYYLMDNTLMGFNRDLADPQHYLHKHKGALENAELSKFLELVSSASTASELQAAQQTSANVRMGVAI